ncbi:MAG TPA: T9SS type A sorting domain-containing protein [Bacteroidia bacterium]|nr:T9SS type A sorting domain-containing protein [Bacteroidia bacterium]
MKKILLIAAIILLNSVAKAQTYVWTQKANFGGGGRYAGAGFSIGTKGYIGTGITHVGSVYTYHNDFWEWDQATNVWAQKANFAGPPRYGASGFAVDQKGYITLGWVPQLNDLWEYNPLTNTWLQKTNFGGSARYDAASFVINNFAYIGTGYAPYKKDFWKYDITNDTWTQVADIGGQPRSTATGFSVGNYGYVACGGQQFTLYTNHLWQYDAIANTWIQKANFPGPARTAASAFAFNGKGYVGVGCTDVSVFTDFYSYDPPTDAWSPIAGFPGQGLIKTVTFSIGNRGYMGTGSDDIYNGGIDRAEFWEYGPVTTSVEENDISNDISIFPNPVNDKFFVRFKKNVSGQLTISLFDLNGRLIKSQNLKLQGNEIEFSTSEIKGGNYLLEILNKSEAPLLRKNIFIQ